MVAWMVVAQLLASNSAFAVVPGSAQSDIFNSSICTTYGIDSPLDTQHLSREHIDQLDCCQLGCSMFTTTLVPTLDGIGPFLQLSHVGVAIRFVAHHPPSANLNTIPGNPRAPPALA